MRQDPARERPFRSDTSSTPLDMAAPPGRTDQGGQEVLEGGTQRGRLSRAWGALPRGRRRLAGAAAALGVLGGAAVPGAAQWREWRAEQRLLDEVTIAAGLGVTSSSTSPGGGRVDFFVTIVNSGSHPVTITAVRGAVRGLVVRDRGALPRTAPAGQAVRVPLSVRLDCPARAAGSPYPALRGGIDARSAGGRPRTVEVTLDGSAQVIGIAETLCDVRPGLRDAELSGPVAATAAGRGTA